MAFRFNKWDEAFKDESLLKTIKAKLEAESNSTGDTGLVSIKVTHLSLGSRPPRLRLHDIPVVSESRVSFLFRVEYDGDASLCVTARLHITSAKTGGIFGATGFFWGGSSRPLHDDDAIPVSVMIESVRVSGMLAVDIHEVVPASRDISIRFMSDPLESVSVSSSLDRQLPFVKTLLNAHISGKLRDFLMNELPELAKKRIDLPFLAEPAEPPSHNSIDMVSNLERFSDLAAQPTSGFAMIARDAASVKSANSRGVILTKTSIRRR